MTYCKYIMLKILGNGFCRNLLYLEQRRHANRAKIKRVCSSTISKPQRKQRNTAYVVVRGLVHPAPVNRCLVVTKFERVRVIEFYPTGTAEIKHHFQTTNWTHDTCRREWWSPQIDAMYMYYGAGRRR